MLGFVLTLAAAALAEIASISVDPATPMPVGITAAYTAELDLNPPPVSGYAWSWRGVGCNPLTWYGGGDEQICGFEENLVGDFVVRCVVTHAGVPKPDDTTKTLNVTVRGPSSDSIDNAPGWTINMNTSLPVTSPPNPQVGFLVNTSAGVAGAYISGTHDRRIVEGNKPPLTAGVARQGNHTVVQFPFMDPNNAFSGTVNGQPFCQVTSTNRIQYLNQCQTPISTPKSLVTRTVKWIKVDATHWKVTIQ
jgi:hypothetical protein